MIREQGFKYRITHERALDGLGEVSDFGGRTVVEIMADVDQDPANGEEAVLAVGEAVCSRHDRFDRKRGRIIAMGRAKVALFGRPGRGTPTV